MTSDAYADFVACAATELAAQGFPPMPARVIMALTASEEGQLTAEALAEQLSASPAAVSGAVRYLATLGFLRQTTARGSRRHVYTLPHTPWYTASLTRAGLYRNITELLTSGATEMPAGSAARARIEEMADFFRFFERRIPLLLDEWTRERAGGGPV